MFENKVLRNIFDANRDGQLKLLFFLFNDGHVLETAAVRGRMIYDGHVITGDECGPNFLTFVLQLRESPEKNLNQQTDPTGERTRPAA